MYLNNVSDRVPFWPRIGVVSPAAVSGQLKLLVATLEFMSNHSAGMTNVVYAGGAPGCNMLYVAARYPHIRFILFDPRAFDERLQKVPNIELRRQLFTNDDAKEFEGAVLISDIRSATNEMGPVEWEKCVAKDMAMQQNWVRIMGAPWALLKFRMPYNKDSIRYLRGALYPQPFAQAHSGELRLIVPLGVKTKKYVLKLLSGTMACHNLLRPKWHPRQHIRKVGLCGCWDCTALVAVVRHHLSMSEDPKVGADDGRVVSEIQKILGAIKPNCKSLTGLLPRGHPHSDSHLGPYYKRDIRKLYDGTRPPRHYSKNSDEIGAAREAIEAAAKVAHVQPPPMYATT